MIDVVRVHITKDQLRRLTIQERAMLFLLGHVANQLAILTKLVAFSSNWRDQQPVEEIVTSAQTQILARYSIGVTNEAWELIHKRFLSSTLGRDYRPLLNAAGQAALTNINKYFTGRENLISKVRSNFVFHNPEDADVDAAFEAIPEHLEWDWYLSPAVINTFYVISDLVITFGMVNATGATDPVAAIEKIVTDVKSVSGWVNDFALSFAEAVLAKHFDKDVTGELVARLDNAPNVFGVRLPFYVEVPDAPEVVTGHTSNSA